MINHEGLWGKVIMEKYIVPQIVVEWIRKEVESHSGTLVVWKALMRAFPLVGKWLACKIGKGNRDRIREYPWMGSTCNFILL
jgi:hypothetical protein